MSPVTFSSVVQRKTYTMPDDPHPWTRGVPHSQPYHVFSPEHDAWQPVDPAVPAAVAELGALERLQVLSWNIDFMRILDDARMTAALNHLQTHVESDDSRATPTVIMLNDMTSSDLRLIQAQDWIREGYHITDITTQFWESDRYGTCVLIPKSLSIAQVCRIHYTVTAMQRDALFVDIRINTSRTTTATASPAHKTLRLCSTHLKSLRSSPPKRPPQLAEAAAHMHAADYAILGGDLNAIQDFDATLYADNGLGDAYLALGGVEGADEGMTWGPTASIAERERFGLTRMDKFLFCGSGSAVEEFETFSEGAEVEGEEDRAVLIEEVGMEKGWVTDHLGIKAMFSIAS